MQTDTAIIWIALLSQTIFIFTIRSLWQLLLYIFFQVKKNLSVSLDLSAIILSHIFIFGLFFSPLVASFVCHTVLYAWTPLVPSSREFLAKMQDIKCLVTLNLLGRWRYQHIMFTWFGKQPMRMKMVWKKSEAPSIRFQVQNGNCTVLKSFL